MVPYPCGGDIPDKHGLNMSYIIKTTKEQISHRLRISLGHLKKVLNMVENNVYCIDTITQILAVEKALKETGNLVLENHLKTCVSDAIKNGNSKQAITEIMAVMKRKAI